MTAKVGKLPPKSKVRLLERKRTQHAAKMIRSALSVYELAAAWQNVIYKGRERKDILNIIAPGNIKCVKTNTRVCNLG